MKTLAVFVSAGAMVEPVNGKNPLVQSASQIHLPLPYEEEYEEGEYEEDGWDTGEWDDVDEPQREPQSEDEQFNGVNAIPPDPGKPRKRHRRPPMPKVPDPDRAPVFVPPFEVLPDGTVTGPKLGDGSDVLPEGFDPPRGSMEGLAQMIYAKPPQSSGGTS